MNNYHQLESIEDTEEFYTALSRSKMMKKLSKDTPYTYWTMELYDQSNGIRGGGGLGILSADIRRIAESIDLPFILLTPFYPLEAHQVFKNGLPETSLTPVNYSDFGFSRLDSVFIRCDGNICRLDVIEKILGTTRILSITEPNFGELYARESWSDHRLYQEVALGFGGYQALKLIGVKPSVIQLNEVATFFSAIARLDELVDSGMNLYEAIVYIRKHTLYTNHTLVQAAEAEFTISQFERFVFPNLKSRAVRSWLEDRFEDGRLRLSSVAVEISELKNCVSRLHARVANYHDTTGEKVKFSAVTNGIDVEKWILKDTLDFYHQNSILTPHNLPSTNYRDRLEKITSSVIKSQKKIGRKILNDTLKSYPDHHGDIVDFSEKDLIFTFKRRFVDYKRPWLAFSDPEKLKSILNDHHAHFILTGRVHEGDEKMCSRLMEILRLVDSDPFLRTHVHYLPDYDETLAYALSVGSNITVNTPIVGLEACGTSWEKDVGNLCLLVSTHDGGVADAKKDSYLCVEGKDETEEIANLYFRMEEAASAWENPYDLEYFIRSQLAAYIEVISGTRMLKDYLTLLFEQ